MGILSFFRQPDTGIYQIQNKENGCVYIGATRISFQKRWQQHVWNLRANRHPNGRLQTDWTIYGERAFVFSIIERIPAFREQHIIDREIYWQDANYDRQYRYNPPNPSIKHLFEKPRALSSDEIEMLAKEMNGLSEDEMLELFALARRPGGSFRFDERRIAKFIKGSYEKRLAQVRRVRGEE